MDKESLPVSCRQYYLDLFLKKDLLLRNGGADYERLVVKQSISTWLMSKKRYSLMHQCKDRISRNHRRVFFRSFRVTNNTWQILWISRLFECLILTNDIIVCKDKFDCYKLINWNWNIERQKTILEIGVVFQFWISMLQKEGSVLFETHLLPIAKRKVENPICCE